jgi:hypothetical protein
MKKRKDRVRVKIFMKHIIEEYDRLNEMSPILPNDIIRWFSDIVNEDEEQYTDCGICCHECFCFACGCNLCTSCLTRCNKHDINKNTKSQWKNMAIPEIIGKISQTTIATIDEEKSKCVVDKKENIYNIYGNNL